MDKAFALQNLFRTMADDTEITPDVISVFIVQVVQTGNGFEPFELLCLNFFVLLGAPPPTSLQTERELTNFRVSSVSSLPDLLIQCFSDRGPGNHVWEGKTGKRGRTKRGWWEPTWRNNVVMKPTALHNEHITIKKKIKQKREKEMQTGGLPHTGELFLTF